MSCDLALGRLCGGARAEDLLDHLGVVVGILRAILLVDGFGDEHQATLRSGHPDVDFAEGFVGFIGLLRHLCLEELRIELAYGL